MNTVRVYKCVGCHQLLLNHSEIAIQAHIIKFGCKEKKRNIRLSKGEKRKEKWKRSNKIILLEREISLLTKAKAKAIKEMGPNARMKGSFYLRPAWHKLRYQAIKTYGRKCMACGSTTKAVHVDHIKPRSLFPKLQLDFNNLQILCKECNMGKSNIDATDWRTPGTESNHE